MNKKQLIGVVVAVIVSAVLVGALVVYGPIAQDVHYHRFADVVAVGGIPNFWAVVSNVPFFVGLWAVLKLKRHLQIIDELKSAYYVFFISVAAVAVGSGYYHWLPHNETLAWDRLPIAIGFMALFVIIIAEYISRQWAKKLFIPLVLLGAFSVLYWHLTEQAGRGDLRFYIVVQFLPLGLIPIILLVGKPTFTHTAAYWQLFAAYMVAKVCEHFDASIYSVLTVGGHSLKHMAAVVGIYCLYRGYKKRQRL